MSTPAIQWYPGHIAKAERNLLEQLKKVDVVLEVRDCRIPLATNHPRAEQWIGNKGRVLVMNRVDMIPTEARHQWEDWLKSQNEAPCFTDGQHGKGVKSLVKLAQRAGSQVNERRKARGMLPRPVRAVMIGFPNVGKSALINRLLGKRVVESARKAGVTRSLRWVRISDQIELLDAPGVLPNILNDQDAAIKLAICDDIGQASYDHQRVAAAMVELLKDLQQGHVLHDRYQVDPADVTGETYVQMVSQQRYTGDSDRAANALLNDYRIGRLGSIALELPPVS
ncbi:ribosome biogenesis GTPase YlqF [filamentous cyanobacterium LEGE 11480]|uniref:Ribosome biogenesis GTPase A n=1 Tax=Romeriopsis navalis LEGE 11480 TaxID=2777977 RepID=A0A928Z1B9_9CYAN|nr:ribosome biogenesis GTPase YlqF [Romeriopsis navalis]MBE9028354.1 ribosome biogenesis GTPase YlqF [Romeriopsis navalis LEGE 11480]